jgi:hypothetical protein
VLLALLEGITLGTLTQPLAHPAAGYVAFFTLIMFLTGLALLPKRAASYQLPAPSSHLAELNTAELKTRN